MKILLINPEFPGYRGKDTFPVGLGYLSGTVRDKDVSVIDCSVDKFSKEKIERINPDIVCITSTTPSFPKAKEYAFVIKKILPDSLVVMGGTHVTFKPEDGLEVADIVVRGEGEITFREIVEAVESGKGFENVRGISFRGKHNPDREPVRNLDSIPLPNYEVFPLEKYGMMSAVTSRGCPYSCSYCCASAFWGRRVRFRSPENVIKELKIISEYGFKLLKFHDSTFTLNEERARRICELMIEEGLDFSWSCETRADHLSPELLRVMKKSGCRLICIGVDSGSPEVLERIGRRISVREMERGFEMARSAGIKTRAYVTFGLPGETEKSVRETLKFLERVRPDQIMLSLATVYPGTELEKGRRVVFDESWVAKFGGHGRGSELYLPDSLNKEEYRKLADFMWEKIKELKKPTKI